MSPIINGFRYSYDYEELINEFKEDIIDQDLSESSIISIVRREEPIADIDYRPIIDYYLPNDIKIITGSLQDVYSYDLFDEDEWYSMEKLRLSMIETYNKDKEHLEKMSVKDVLTEMETWNKIL